MATDTAVTSRPKSIDPTQHIWQVPFFLFAVLVFAANSLGLLPFGPPDPRSAFAIDVANLKNTYEKVNLDYNELKELLVKVAGAIDLSPDKNETHFVLGSGYARLAELSPSAEDAQVYWKLTQQHFDLIDRNLFRNSENSTKLTFRAAKARAAIGLTGKMSTQEMKELIELLDKTPFGDDPGEALRLRAEVAMRLSPPDRAVARDSLTRYLTGTPVSPAISREPSRILLAEILFQDKQLKEVEKWLKSIASDAPPEVVIAGKALMARFHMAEIAWQSACREWEALRALPNLPPAVRTMATYQLGYCKLNIHEPEEAVKLLEEAVRGEDCPETSAAAFRLAEQYLKSSDPARRAACVDLLVRAMKGVTSPMEFRSHVTLITLNEVKTTFDLAFEKLTADGAYEAALKVVAAFAPISEAGHDREKRADILAAWARALQRTKYDYKTKALEAAREYLAFAELQTADSARADTLRRSAKMFIMGEEPKEGVTALLEASKLARLTEEIAGQVWLDLVDALIAAYRPTEVWPALNKAMGSGGTASMKTRYRLALLFKEQPQPELRLVARLLLEQIANQTMIGTAEQEYHELALELLGHEFIRSLDFAMAENYLRKQLHIYPTGPEANLGRLLLGVSLLQLAVVPPPTGPTAAKIASMRDEALKLFRTIVSEMDAKLKKEGKLNNHESWLRVQAAIRVLQVHVQTKNYNELFYESEDLRQRHRGTVEELIIWNLVYQAFQQQAKDAPRKEDVDRYRVRMLETRDKMKEVFDSLPPTAFTAPVGEYSRAYWEKAFGPEK